MTSNILLKSIFFAWHLFMHMLNISIIYMQSIRKLQLKIWYNFTSLCMHYLSKSKTSKQEKMAKFANLSFCHKIFFWHQTSSCKCSMCLIVYAKYQMTSIKALVQVDFPVMYYLSTNKTLIKKQCKMAKFKTLSFCQKVFLWHQTFSNKCSMCLHCVYKVSGCFSKIPLICTTYAPLRITKGNNSNRIGP